MASWYVDAVNGLDSNPGTALLPWKTVQKAADTVVAGDKVYGTGEEILTAIIDFDTNTGSLLNGRVEYIACNNAFLPTKWGWIWNANGAVASIIKTYVNIDYQLFNGIHLKSSTSHAVVSAANNYSYANDFYQCKFELIGGQAFGTYYQQAFSIRSCYFINIIGSICNGLYFGKFTDNTVINWSAAIAIVSSYATLFTGNVFHQCKTVISIKNSIQAYFFKNNVFNLCEVGIENNIAKTGYYVSIEENRFTNCGIGIRTNETSEWFYENNNYFANNTTDISQTAGRVISGGDSIFGGTVDGYVDATALNFALKPDAIMRRVYRETEHRYVTAGIPGADVYPQDFYLDKSVVSTTAGTVLTITLKHLASSLITGLTIGGVACTDLTVTGASTATVKTPTLTANTFDVAIALTGYDAFTKENIMTASSDAPPPGPDNVMGMLIKLHKAFYGTGKIEESPEGSGRFYLVLYDNDGSETDTVIAKCELKGYGGAAVASFVGNTSPCVRLKSMIDVVPTIPESATVLGILEKMMNYEFGTKLQKEIPVGSGKFFEVTYDSTGREIGRCPLKAYGGAEIASPEGSTEPTERLRSIV